MALLKVDLKFSLSYSGWKETYWVDPSGGTPESYLSTAEAFGGFRVALLCQGATLEEISIVNTAILRHSVVSTLYNRAAPGNADSPRDVQDAGVRIKMESENRLRNRTLWLRGIPDRFIVFNGNRQVFSEEARGQLNTFLAVVKSLPSVIHGSSRPGADVNAVRITAVSKNAAGTRVVITSPGHGYTGGEVVTIRRVKFLNEQLAPGKLINGTHYVIPASQPLNPANTFEINVPPGLLLPDDYTGTGLQYKRFVVTSPVAFLRAVEWASRSTGRPIVNTRGRRASKRLLGIPA